jgi:hypothetical protein
MAAVIAGLLTRILIPDHSRMPSVPIARLANPGGAPPPMISRVAVIRWMIAFRHTVQFMRAAAERSTGFGGHSLTDKVYSYRSERGKPAKRIFFSRMAIRGSM